jgi:hypothetical protein
MECGAERNVYLQPYLVKGGREYVAVDSRGELIATRIVGKQDDATAAIASLWYELNELDPLPTRTPELRLV